MSISVTLSDIRNAATRIRPETQVSPILSSAHLPPCAGQPCLLKSESFQPIGAFKVRGALNAVRQIAQGQLSRGLVCESSGNHAQAIAYAAKIFGVPAHVVMPTNAPEIKVAAVRALGANIYFCEPNEQARKELATTVQLQSGATLIHPWNNDHVIAGQGTIGLEILEQVPPVDLVVSPIGGGGLLSGVSIALKSLRPAVQVVGVEPEGANDYFKSRHAGKIEPVPGGGRSIAEGLLSTVGPRTFEILQEYVDDVVTVSECEIAQTVLFLFQKLKLVVEPSGAVALAALLHGRVPEAAGKTTVAIITGGNMSASRLMELEEFVRAAR